jgi:hypothetical protein
MDLWIILDFGRKTRIKWIEHEHFALQRAHNDHYPQAIAY